MKARIAHFLATGCYIGMIPGAPGTYASMATTLVYFLIRLNYWIKPELHLSAVCLITVVGVYTSASVSRSLGKEDPGVVVIDEVAGQLLALMFLPVTALNLLGGTLLFRLFDIWKPYPIRKLEEFKNGVGIMADDLLAGVYANIVLQIVKRIIQG